MLRSAQSSATSIESIDLEQAETPAVWTTLHAVNDANGWAAGERKMFKLQQPTPVDGFQYRLLILATNSPGAPTECEVGENGTDAWRGRHRCNQRALHWGGWMQWMYTHAWHHGLQVGGAPVGAPVVAEWELFRCDDHYEQQQRWQQLQHTEATDAWQVINMARPEDRKFLL